MLKGFLASTVIPKLLFAIFHGKGSRKDNLPPAMAVVVQVRYGSSWCPSVKSPGQEFTASTASVGREAKCKDSRNW